MQQDTDQMGDSEFAERVVLVSYGGGREEERLLDWTNERCPFASIETVTSCVTSLGLQCDPPTQDALACRYAGSLRTRRVTFVGGVITQATQWRTMSFLVELNYDASGGGRAAYSSRTE